MKKVLFISVHPDDETLGCGGTILKHKNNKDNIYWLIISTPTSDRPCGLSLKFIENRHKLIKRISNKYGFKITTNLTLPPQFLHQIDIKEIVVKVGNVIEKIKPEIIYIFNRSDVHSDHRVSFNAVYSATKSFRKPFIEKILMYETLSETEFAPALIENAFIPNIFVDITKYMKKKIEIMKMYKTEMMPSPLPRSIRTIEALAKYRGTRIGVDYAESFMLLYEKC